MRNKIIIGIFLLASPMFSFGQNNSGCYVKKYFLLIQSTTNYKNNQQIEYRPVDFGTLTLGDNKGAYSG